MADPVTLAAIGSTVFGATTTAGAITAGAATMGAAGLIGSKVLGGIMAPKAPDVKAPTVMPTANSEDVAGAKRRQLQALQARGGRLSTILSDGAEGGDKLGG